MNSPGTSGYRKPPRPQRPVFEPRYYLVYDDGRVPSTATPLHRLEPQACHWVCTDPGVGRMDEALLCGQPRRGDGSPYCAYHHSCAIRHKVKP